MPTKPAHLAPSELGTKEYWESLYATELANNDDNPDDTGTVWFDDVDAETRMVSYLGELIEQDTQGAGGSGGDSPVIESLAVIDLGCGNGSLLRALRDELDERGLMLLLGPPHAGVRLLGVDYSAASIALARRVTEAAAEEEEEEEVRGTAIELAEWDVLRGDAGVLGQEADTWDVVLDKGTFDAISLGHGQDGQDEQDGQYAATSGDTVESLYLRQVLRLLRPGGRFLVTSCNWTEAELDAWMTADEAGSEAGRLERVGRVTYPSFQFGGVQGQAVCTSCFVKRTG